MRGIAARQLLRHLTGACLIMLLASAALRGGQLRLLDAFETVSGWEAVTSHGDASKITITSGPGRTGRAMVMQFSFLGHMGSAAAEKKFAIPLPSNYQISFDIRADAPVNNFILRLMDSLGNVWVVMRTDYEFPKTWTRFTVRKDQIRYGWGPSGHGDLRTLDRLMVMIDVVEGGKGTLWIDNLSIESLDEASAKIPRFRSSSPPAAAPVFSHDGRTMTGWRSRGENADEWLSFDFGGPTYLGGLVIDWQKDRFAGEFLVQLSNDGRRWTAAWHVGGATGKKSCVFLAGDRTRYVRMQLHKSPTGRFGIDRLEFKGPEFSFSINDFFTAIASESPRGYYPKYLVPQQSYWTVVGAAGDTREALINEQGMIETDKRTFSLEPFLFVGGHLVTWGDATITQSLQDGYLPVPSVRWETRDGLVLTVTACAGGDEGESVLYVRYAVRNEGSRHADGLLFIAARPFQVNPPWQTFTIVGGAARVDSVRCGDTLLVQQKHVFPVSRPDGVGAASVAQGDVTGYFEEGELPPARTVHDSFGHASAALKYDFSLGPQEQRTAILAVPFHPTHARLPVNLRDAEAAGFFRGQCDEVTAFWRKKIGVVGISLPPPAPPVAATIRSNLAYILINADGPALQPGSRSYERSWLRDGALTSAALLQMGITAEVRRYLDWYATYQYPDGAIPCVVESRGPEPTPEHDSHGEFIYAILQYFAFTHDTLWLRGKWDAVARTVGYIHSLRAQRKTDIYKNGTPDQRACYGLVPESISHEGYCPKPMHSYWDDFFIMRGLKDATTIAGILGKAAEAKAFAAERDDFRHDLYASMRLAIANTGVTYIPGCVELGDFSGLSTTIAISPCGEMANLPRAEMANTFDQSYKMFLERKTNSVSWDSYLPYEARFIGSYVFLGERDRANAFLEYIMRDRRPAAWNGWGEIVWKDRDAPRNIGDMPHAWAASDFIRSVRTMLVYEREDDGALVVGAGIPASWISEPPGLRVDNLPTYFGPLSFTVAQQADSVVIHIAGQLDIPPGKIILKCPPGRPPVAVLGGGHWDAVEGGIIPDSLPAGIILKY